MKRLFPAILALCMAVPFGTVYAADENESGTRWQAREITMQNFRPIDKRGINMFEPPKSSGPDYSGFKLDWNAAISAGAQALHHKNNASSKIVSGIDTNQLIKMGPGFNTPNANLYINVQLSDGIRMMMSIYASSRHHNEFWVKDGYVLIDKLPFENKFLDSLMEITTIKAGHMEINYGDQHFRRSDNGLTMYNPFIDNLILDAFTTEIGAEVYIRPYGILDGLMLMGGITGGEIKGNTQNPEYRSPAFLGKISYDTQWTSDLRFRVSTSLYYVDKSPSSTLYAGDRAGSKMFNVMESVTAKDTAANFRSGGLNPGFSRSVTAFQVNPFMKYGGFELFGVLEFASGNNGVESKDRFVRQYAMDAVYRFLKNEKAYVGARWNRVEGELVPLRNDTQNINRYAVGTGYFLTNNIMIKAEYIKQNYGGFDKTDIRRGGSFSGPMMEMVIAF